MRTARCWLLAHGTTPHARWPPVYINSVPAISSGLGVYWQAGEEESRPGEGGAGAELLSQAELFLLTGWSRGGPCVCVQKQLPGPWLILHHVVPSIFQPIFYGRIWKHLGWGTPLLITLVVTRPKLHRAADIKMRISLLLYQGAISAA